MLTLPPPKSWHLEVGSLEVNRLWEWILHGWDFCPLKKEPLCWDTTGTCKIQSFIPSLRSPGHRAAGATLWSSLTVWCALCCVLASLLVVSTASTGTAECGLLKTQPHNRGYHWIMSGCNKTKMAGWGLTSTDREPTRSSPWGFPSSGAEGDPCAPHKPASTVDVVSVCKFHCGSFI